MSAAMPRVRMWLTGFGWLVGAALFIRFLQILPCCAPTPVEVALRSHICACQASFVTACPTYEDSAPR
jgi:hypothetical protein